MAKIDGEREVCVTDAGKNSMQIYQQEQELDAILLLYLFFSLSSSLFLDWASEMEMDLIMNGTQVGM